MRTNKIKGMMNTKKTSIKTTNPKSIKKSNINALNTKGRNINTLIHAAQKTRAIIVA